MKYSFKLLAKTMNKTILILKHEFRQTIKRKGFIIMTLAFPLLALLAMGAYQIIQGRERPPGEVVTIGYVDEVGIFTGYTQWYQVELAPYATPEGATDALLEGEIDEYFVIPSNYLDTGVIDRFIQERELEPDGQTRAVVRDFLLSNLLAGYTSEEILLRVRFPLSLNTTILDETGQIATDQGGFGAFIVPFFFGFLLIMAIFSSSGYLLQGLGEEKENRIMEILLSSVSARQLLTGKVLGLGAAGLVQILFWLLSATFLVRMASTIIGGELGTIQISGSILVLGIVYFVLGYLFFAVLMAGIGAIGATARESQQLSVIIVFPAMVPIYVFLLLMRSNPDHVIGRVLTLIPFTAPVMTFIRLGLTGIPAWELALSLVLLVVSIIGALFLSAKVFRVFLLMYGKTPKPREILKLIRQA